MLFEAASFGGSFSSSMIRIQFSTTTMASSTSDPITRIRANIVRTFIENPSGTRNMNVPIRETGMAAEGISVALQSCRKM